MMTSTLVGAAMSLGFPLFSLVLENQGEPRWVIGLITAAQGLGVFCIAPFAPRIIERLMARRTMQLGIILSVIAILLMPLNIEPVTWFVLRLLLGMGAGLIFIVSEAAVNALAQDHNRGRILGVYGTLFCVGYAAGPLIIATAGTEGWQPYLMAATLLALGLWPAFAARAIDPALAGHQPPFFSKELLTAIKIALLPLTAIIIFGLTEASIFGFLPLYGLDHGLLENTAALMLSVWIAGNIILQYPIGMISDRFPRRLVLVWSAALAALFIAALPWVIGSDYALWPVLLAQGSAMGGIYVLSLALLGERFRGPMLAVANTAFVVAIELGLIIGPAMTGLLITGFTSAILPWAMAGCLAALSMVAFFARPHSKAVSNIDLRR